MSALIALIATRAIVATSWTCALDKAVCQEGLVILAKGLLSGLFCQVPVLVQFRKDILRNLRLLRC